MAKAMYSIADNLNQDPNIGYIIPCVFKPTETETFAQERVEFLISFNGTELASTMNSAIISKIQQHAQTNYGVTMTVADINGPKFS